MAANFVGAKHPFRCDFTESSHSSSVMLKIIRSRRMPCAQTRMSSLPQRSSAVRTSPSATSISETSPMAATASPPAAVISSTTALTRLGSIPIRPSTSAPVSATMTLAPCSAKMRQIQEPMPPAPPVTIAVLPSRCFAIARAA